MKFFFKKIKNLLSRLLGIFSLGKWRGAIHLTLHFLFLVTTTVVTGWVGCPWKYVLTIFIFHGLLFVFYAAGDAERKRKINLFMLALLAVYIIFMLLIAFLM